MLRNRTLAFVPAVLALLGASALASVASPVSGTPLDLKIGASLSVKLKNAGGCTFDYTAEVDDPDIVSVSRLSGTDVKNATITLTALKVGSTMLTLATSGGSCPPANHTYAVNVAYDEKLMLKAFATYTKDATSDVKAGIKSSFSTYNDSLKSIGVDYKADVINDDELQDRFHTAADMLRRSIYLTGTEAYSGVVSGGSLLLADNGLSLGEGPLDFFAGGCGSFDDFQDSVCSGFAKTHDTFDKASKKGISTFNKAGAPLMGQWNLIPPLYSGGPVYPEQSESLVAPEPIVAPFTFTTRAVSALGGDGRLRVSGMGDTALTGQLVVTLRRLIDGELPETTTLMPEIVDNEWTATFSDLVGGSYSLDTRYAGDSNGYVLPLHIAHQF